MLGSNIYLTLNPGKDRCGSRLISVNSSFKVIFLLLICLLFSACEQEHEPNNFVAYSWSETTPQEQNIIPFYWLRADNFHDLDRLVAQAKAATDAMPQGHRALFSWDIHRSMAYQRNGDFLYTEQGDIAGCNSEAGFKPYRSLWWDNGVQFVRQRFERFFKAYSDAGGELDVFVLDFEQGFSYWHLRELAENSYASCGLDAYLDAIQNDKRFSHWRERLGFDDLKTLNQWYENDNHLKWSALVWEHLAAYIEQAVYQPMKKYFPQADFSNYGYYYQQSELNFPDIHGYYRHKYTDGIHVGTHQSREIYGWVDLPTQIKLADRPYPVTPYNAFRFAVNKLRAMLVSSEVPISPWVAYKGFSNGHLHNNDYYQELIFHILLSGVDYLLYWNPAELKDFEPDNNRLLNDLIQQVNSLINSRNIRFETSELANWFDQLLITKIKLADGQQLWRVTANLEADEKIADHIVAEKPLRLNVKGLDYDFAGMQLLKVNQELSSKGLWLVGPGH